MGYTCSLHEGESVAATKVFMDTDTGDVIGTCDEHMLQFGTGIVAQAVGEERLPTFLAAWLSELTGVPLPDVAGADEGQGSGADPAATGPDPDLSGSASVPAPERAAKAPRSRSRAAKPQGGSDAAKAD